MISLCCIVLYHDIANNCVAKSKIAKTGKTWKYEEKKTENCKELL